MPQAAIYEMDEERDRKTCLSLDHKVTGANRELAQWLLDHPRYSAPQVAEWLGCGDERIRRLRIWAKDGFEGSPQSRSRTGHKTSSPRDGVLETNDNPETEDQIENRNEDPEMVEDADQVATNALDTIKRQSAVAKAYRKVFQVSSLDRAAKEEVRSAIAELISKWQSVQRLLG